MTCSPLRTMDWSNVYGLMIKDRSTMVGLVPADYYRFAITGVYSQDAYFDVNTGRLLTLDEMI